MLLEVKLRFTTGPATKLNLGRFRLSCSDDAKSVDLDRTLADLNSKDPWTKLAAVRRGQDDQSAVDILIQQHPASAGAIGDLFIPDGDDVEKDWDRAVHLYSLAIDAETNDSDLLAKRARAYEALQQWEAAAVDWARAAQHDPRGEELLIEFTNRLEQAGQRSLAAAQRRSIRESLEAALEADPQCEPVMENLSQLLLDANLKGQPQWNVLGPDRITLTGEELTFQEDDSIVINSDRDAAESDDWSLQIDTPPAKAVRVEYTTEETTSAEDAEPVKEYQLLSAELASSTSPTIRGRYVRIDVPGDAPSISRLPAGTKFLVLSEVQVFVGDRNVAFGANARQSALRSRRPRTTAQNAVDGETRTSRSTRPFVAGGLEPWWEVDLGKEIEIDRIKVFRPPMSALASNIRVQVINNSRQVIFEQFDTELQESKEYSRSFEMTKVAAMDDAVDQERWMLSLDRGKASSWRRLRVSSVDELAVVRGQATTTPNPAHFRPRVWPLPTT